MKIINIIKTKSFLGFRFKTNIALLLMNIGLKIFLRLMGQLLRTQNYENFSQHKTYLIHIIHVKNITEVQSIKCT